MLEKSCRLASDWTTPRINDAVSGRNALKNPTLCLAELGAAVARRFPDQPLGAGEIVGSGTLTAGHATGRGDEWAAEVEGLFLAPLTLGARKR